MAGLDDVLGGLTSAAGEFNSSYLWNPDTESGSFGWNPSGGAAALGRDEGGNLASFRSGDYGITPTNINSSLSYDFNKPLFNAGYDLIDPRQVSQVADKNFNGDATAALQYRYGNDATFLQDKRFAPYDATGMGLFAKPTDTGRLGMGGSDSTKYPLWNLPDSQPSLFGGIMSGDWPATKIAGLVASGGASFPGMAAGMLTGNGAASALVNLASGQLGGGGSMDGGLGFDPADLPAEKPFDFSQFGGAASSFPGGMDNSLFSASGDSQGNLFAGGAMSNFGSNLLSGSPFSFSGADPMAGLPTGSSGGFASDLMNYLSSGKGINSALSVGSGIYGLIQQQKLRQQALAAQKQADPWGASGGRAAADSQLQQFMRDPSAAAAADPSYALRLQAAQRAAAPYGQGSGKMAIDAAGASTSWYNDRLAQLGSLAGTGINPGTGAQLSLEGNIGANKLAGDSLASIGYGAGNATVPPAMMQQLMIRMMQQMGTQQ